MAEDSASSKGVSRGDNAGTKGSASSSGSRGPGGPNGPNSGPSQNSGGGRGAGGSSNRGPGGPNGPNSGPSSNGGGGLGGGNKGTGGGGMRGAGSNTGPGSGRPGSDSNMGGGGQRGADGKSNFGGGMGGNSSRVGGPGGGGGMGAENVRNGSSPGPVGSRSGYSAPGNVGGGRNVSTGQMQRGVTSASARVDDKYQGMKALMDSRMARMPNMDIQRQSPAQMAAQYSQYRAPPGATPRGQQLGQTDVSRLNRDIEVTRALNAEGIKRAAAAGQRVPSVDTSLTTNNLYGDRPSFPQSATAAEDAVRRDFGYQQIGSLFNDPAIHPALPEALSRGLWNQRIQDATRLAGNPNYTGSFGERDLAPWDDAGFRTREQAEKNFKNKTGIKDSFHNYGLAADITYPGFPGYDDPNYKQWDNRSAVANRELAGLIENDDIQWGGTFSRSDPSHFQLGTGSRADAIDTFGPSVTREGVRPNGVAGGTASLYGNERPSLGVGQGQGHVVPAGIDEGPAYPGGDGITGEDIGGLPTEADAFRSLPSGTWTQSYDRPAVNTGNYPSRGTVAPGFNMTAQQSGMFNTGNYPSRGDVNLDNWKTDTKREFGSLNNRMSNAEGFAPDVRGNSIVTGDASPQRLAAAMDDIYGPTNTVPDWRQSTYTGPPPLAERTTWPDWGAIGGRRTTPPSQSAPPTEINIGEGIDYYDPLSSIKAPSYNQPTTHVVGGGGFVGVNPDAGEAGRRFDASKLAPDRRDVFYGGGPTQTAAGSSPPRDNKPSYVDPIMGEPPEHLPEKPGPWKWAETLAPWPIKLAMKALPFAGGIEWDNMTPEEREALMEKWAKQNQSYLSNGNLGGQHNETSALLGNGNNAYIPPQAAAPPPPAAGGAAPPAPPPGPDPLTMSRRRYYTDPSNYGFGPGFNYFYYS